MSTGDNSSLQCIPKQKLTDFIEECCEILSGLSSSQSPICTVCRTSFMTMEELVAHGNVCDGEFGTAILSKIKIVSNMLDEHIAEFFKRKIRKEQVTLRDCRYCLRTIQTERENIAHKALCRMLGTINTIKHMYRKCKTMWSDPEEEQITITPLPSTSSAPSSDVINSDGLSCDLSSNGRPPLSFSKSSKSEQKLVPKFLPQIIVNRQLKGSVFKRSGTKSESSLETFLPTSKMFRSSDKDIMDIETKETFDCVICLLTFESIDALKTHISQCLKI